MPTTAKKIKDKWRVVEKATGKIAKNKAGTAVDGGGHPSRAAAMSQSQGININMARKKGHRIPRPKKKTAKKRKS